MARPGGITAREGMLVLAIGTLGFVLRIWLITAAGLEHYDEGVYALTGLGLADEAQEASLYPGQSRFSPLLYPLLIAATFRVLGPSDIVAILPNVALGTLSVFLVWSIGRRWFGPVAGLAASALLATSELHIALSRSALTDVAFLLLFLGALGLLVEAQNRQSMAWALLAGLATGLAWNTKYHGWLALIPTGCALFLFTVRNRRHVGTRPLMLWAVSGLTALLLFLPWILFVSSEPGGYPGLVSYQRSMLQGEWLGNLAEQVGQLAYMDGATSRAGFATVILFILIAPHALGRRWSGCIRLLALLVGLALLGAVGLAALLTLIWMTGRIARSSTYADLVLAAWVLLWVVIAPLYTPYVRLILPFTVAVFMGAGAWLQTMVQREERAYSMRQRWFALLPMAGIAGWIMSVLLGLRNPVSPWRPATDYRLASFRIAASLPEDARVLVIGQPEIAFYLTTAGFHAASPEPEPAEWGSETFEYLIAGVYAHRAPKLRSGLAALDDRLHVVGQYPVVPKDLRILDDFRSERAREYARSPDGTFDLVLYRVSPVGSS